jgi:hypothetical protein
MSKKLQAEIEALKQRVAELEARPPQAHYHTHYHGAQPPQPWAQLPCYPYPWTAIGGSAGHQQ